MKSAKKAKPVATKKAVNAAAKVNVKVKKVAPKVATKATNKAATKVVAHKDKQTRIEILQSLAEQTNLTRVQVESLFDALNNVIEGHMKKRGSGEFTIPKTGIKIRRIKKKATKSRKMVSPLTGQEVTIAAKPARFTVKLSALKTLKEMIEQ